MTSATRRRQRCGVAVVALLLGGLVTGCGQETPPDEAAPALAERLDQVDAAVVDEDYAKAANAVESLVAETTEAEEAGEISGEQADRIRTAAKDLLAQLPADVPAEAPSPDPTPTEGDQDGDEGSEEKKDDDKDDKGDRDEGKDEERKDEKKGKKGEKDDD